MSPLASLVVAVLRDPDVASALRDALGSSRDETVPLRRAAEELGSTVRALRETSGHKDLAKRLTIEGPRNARVVRRSELDRWLAATAPRLAKTTPPDAANDTRDEHAEYREAYAASVQRKRARR